MTNPYQIGIFPEILFTSVFSEEQNVVRRKEYLVLVTMNPEAIGTSEFNIIDRKKFQVRFGSYAMRMTSVVLRENN